MSRALAHVRDRFEATPRSLDDDDLSRIARGDRGCLGDLLSGFGAVTLVAAVILGAMGKIPFFWTYAGVALWVGGFVWGTVAQARSGRVRKDALSSGPLVMAVVLRSEDWLRRPGKRVGRAVVVFTTDDELRFDREWIERAAQTLDEGLDAKAGGAEWVPLRALLADRDAFGVHRVPGSLLPPSSGDGDIGPVYLASMLVYPERLESAYLGGDDDQVAGELDVDIDAPRRASSVFAIVEPAAEFIEQVPRPPTAPAPDEASQEE